MAQRPKPLSGLARAPTSRLMLHRSPLPAGGSACYLASPLCDTDCRRRLLSRPAGAATTYYTTHPHLSAGTQRMVYSLAAAAPSVRAASPRAPPKLGPSHVDWRQPLRLEGVYGQPVVGAVVDDAVVGDAVVDRAVVGIEGLTAEGVRDERLAFVEAVLARPVDGGRAAGIRDARVDVRREQQAEGRRVLQRARVVQQRAAVLVLARELLGGAADGRVMQQREHSAHEALQTRGS